MVQVTSSFDSNTPCERRYILVLAARQGVTCACVWQLTSTSTRAGDATLIYATTAQRHCWSTTCEGVRWKAHDPAPHVEGSRPRSRARWTFLNGKSAAARYGTPAHACPHVASQLLPLACTSRDADMCLCLQCAGDALSIDTAATAAITVAIAAITVAAPLPRLPWRRRSSGARVRLTGPRLRPWEAAGLPAHWVFFRWSSRSASVGVG